MRKKSIFYLLFLIALMIPISLNLQFMDLFHEIGGKNTLINNEKLDSLSKETKISNMETYNLLTSGGFSMSEIEEFNSSEFEFRCTWGGFESQEYGPVEGQHADDIDVGTTGYPPDFYANYYIHYPNQQYYTSLVNASFPEVSTRTHDFVRVSATEAGPFIIPYFYEIWITRFFHKEVVYLKNFSVSANDIVAQDIKLYGLHSITEWGNITIDLYRGDCFLDTIWTSEAKGDHSIEKSILSPIIDNGPGTYTLSIRMLSGDKDESFNAYYTGDGEETAVYTHTHEFFSKTELSNLNITCFKTDYFDNVSTDDLSIPKLNGENFSISGILKNATDNPINGATIHTFWTNISNTWTSDTLKTDNNGYFSGNLTIPEVSSSFLDLKLNYTKPFCDNFTEYHIRDIKIFQDIHCFWDINDTLLANNQTEIKGRITSLSNFSMNICNQNFSLFLDGDKLINFVTDENGNFSIEIQIPNISGPKELQIILNTNSGKEISLNESVMILKSALFYDVYVEDMKIPKFIGEDISLSGYLRDLNSNGIPDAEIGFYWRNSSVSLLEGYSQTNLSGYFHKNLSISNILQPFDQIKINYTSTFMLNYSHFLIKNLNIFKNISFNWNIDNTVTEGFEIILHGKIFSFLNESVGINNRTFNLLYAGKILTAFKTDVNGNFSLNITIPKGIGSKSLQIVLNSTTDVFISTETYMLIVETSSYSDEKEESDENQDRAISTTPPNIIFIFIIGLTISAGFFGIIMIRKNRSAKIRDMPNKRKLKYTQKSHSIGKNGKLNPPLQNKDISNITDIIAETNISKEQIVILKVLSDNDKKKWNITDLATLLPSKENVLSNLESLRTNGFLERTFESESEILFKLTIFGRKFIEDFF